MNIALDYLRTLVTQADAGSRLPTVRSVMEQLGVSQKVVQDAISVLTDEGLVEAYVGRGTFVSASDGPLFEGAAKKRKSVILLTRNVGSARTRRVLARLQERLSNEGVDAIQLTYSEIEHGLYALRGLPRMDLCIIQSHFEAVSIELLAAVKRKSRAILFDGATIAGLDVDIAESDWRTAMEKALELLIENGHQSIGMIGSSLKSRPVDAIRSHYKSLAEWSLKGISLYPPLWMSELPSEGELVQTEAALRKLMRENDGCLPFSAIMIWGALDGQILENMFERLGLKIPDDLSVILIGHRNVISESNNFFTISGSGVDQTVDTLVELAMARMDNPGLPFAQKIHPVELQIGRSVGVPK